MKKSVLKLALGLGLGLAAGLAAAQSHSVYIGGVYLDVHAKAPALEGGPAVPAPGGLLDVGDASTTGFGYAYHFTPQWSVEVALGIPPRHKVYGRGFLEPFGQISSVKQLPPTVFVNYRFGEIIPRLTPLVGLGVNYTKFSSAHSTASGDAASGGSTKINVSDSWGLAAHVGLNFQIDKNWALVGTVATAKVKSDMKAVTSTRTGDVTRTTTIDFRPIAYSMSLGYSF